MNVNNKVIIWSIDDFNTLGLIRELGKANLDLIFLIKGKKGFTVESKYCKKYIETPSIEDGYKYLINNFKCEKIKPIIITSNDEIITFIDEKKDELEKYFILPGTKKKGNIKKYIDKNTMTKLAVDMGILCPKSRYIQWNSNIEGIEYPCLIKPSHQKTGHYNEFKFKICKDKNSLRKTLNLVRKDSEFILQQYIPKNLDLLVYACRMLDGKTIIAGAFIRDRWADSGSSSHGYLVEKVPGCVDVNKIQKFVEKIDYYGLFSVEYGLIDGKAYFFEINLRNDGTSHYFYQSGANLPLAYVYSCAGLDYTLVPTKVIGKNWFIDEVFDFENVLLFRISKSKYNNDLKEATIFKYFDREDIIPYKIVKRGKVKQIIRDILLMKFRLYIVYIMDKIGIRK